MLSILETPEPYLDDAFDTAVELYMPEKFRPFMGSELRGVVLEFARTFHTLGALNAAALVRNELGRPNDRRCVPCVAVVSILEQAEKIIAQACPPEPTGLSN